MKGKGIIELLQQSPDFAEAEVYFSIWTTNGEQQFETHRSLQPLQIETGSKGGKYLRLSWTDNCIAHQLFRKDGIIQE